MSRRRARSAPYRARRIERHAARRQRAAERAAAFEAFSRTPAYVALLEEGLEFDRLDEQLAAEWEGVEPRCAHPEGCELAPVPGDIYCRACREDVERDADYARQEVDA